MAFACAAVSAGTTAAAPSSSSCTITVPAEIKGGQARWLGGCVSGRAAGVGVLRVADGSGFAFFFGRVVAGRPTTGLVMHASGDYMEIRGIDRAGRVLIADGEHIPEQDRAWADADVGARLVARGFAKSGNTASSNFYMRWAHRIETQRPE